MNPFLNPTHITVVIRDESPLHINEPCSYRRVTVALTPEQAELLTMKFLGVFGGFEQFERPCSTFLEFNKTP